ncbi:hypothetical protein MPER_13391, partial [Moniliophthora perniciosa FA553]
NSESEPKSIIRNFSPNRAFFRSTAPIDGVNDAGFGTNSRPVSVENPSTLGWKAFTFGIDVQGQDKPKLRQRVKGILNVKLSKLDCSQLDNIQPIQDLVDKIHHQR